MTFATLGMPLKERNDRIKSLFDDPRFGINTVGYRLDAHTVFEIHKNRTRRVPVYDIYRNRYHRYGKGLVLPSRTPDPSKPASFKLVDGMDNSNFDISGLTPHIARIGNAERPDITSSNFKLTIKIYFFNPMVHSVVQI